MTVDKLDVAIVVGIQLGLADGPFAIEAAMKLTHDKLIADLGDRRRSGILWDVLEGEKRIRRELDRFDHAGVDLGQAAIRVELERCLFRPALVIAFCDAIE